MHTAPDTLAASTLYMCADSLLTSQCTTGLPARACKFAIDRPCTSNAPFACERLVSSNHRLMLLEDVSRVSRWSHRTHVPQNDIASAGANTGYVPTDAQQIDILHDNNMAISLSGRSHT